MTVAEVWNLVLAGIAAVTGVAAVFLWFVDRHVTKQETPEPGVHVRFTPWRPPWIQHERDGREYAHLVITNSGDAVARHIEITGDGADFRLEHNHEIGRLAALAPGQQADVPISWRDGGHVAGRVLWVWGRGRKLKVDKITFATGSAGEGPVAS